MFFDPEYCRHERQTCPPHFCVRPLGLSVFSVENKTDIALDMVLTEVCGWLMSVW